jgi:hypothetical protein
MRRAGTEVMIWRHVACYQHRNSLPVVCRKPRPASCGGDVQSKCWMGREGRVSVLGGACRRAVILHGSGFVCRATSRTLSTAFSGGRSEPGPCPGGKDGRCPCRGEDNRSQAQGPLHHHNRGLRSGMRSESGRRWGRPVLLARDLQHPLHRPNQFSGGSHCRLNHPRASWR